jgi:hypothetical protein
VGLLVLLAAAAPAAAQDTAIVIRPDSQTRLTGQALPRIVADEAVRLYNAPTTTRLVGRSRLPGSNAWRGDVAVRNGPALIAGRVEGTLLVINGDAALEPGAEITGDLLVVGGTAEVPGDAHVRGEVRQYREPLPYKIVGEGIEYAPNQRNRFPTLGVERTWETKESRSSVTIATGGTFNRVEGLPIVFGPLFDWRVGEHSRLRIDALGVFRSAGDLSDSRSDLGYTFRAEGRSGEGRGIGLGMRAYDVVAPTEDWGLRAHEVGWASFLFHRDYRDYYLSKGLAGYVFAQYRPFQLNLEVRRDLQASVAARDPWTVFRTDQIWRPNPEIDGGHYVTIGATLTLDSRNDTDDPSTGWYARATFETSRSDDVVPQVGIPPSVRDPIPVDGSYGFDRFFFDVRRYSRVSASGRLNLRLLAAGHLGGDPLPVQQRVSLGGPDPFPGYAFRHSACNADVTSASYSGTLVAVCDQMLALQVEYRGHLSLNWTYNPSGGERKPLTQLWLEGLDLVVFANAGQAWLGTTIPPLEDWIADLGLGVDWGGFGVYVAKAMTVGEEVRVTVRLDHRF